MALLFEGRQIVSCMIHPSIMQETDRALIGVGKVIEAIVSLGGLVLLVTDVV